MTHADILEALKALPITERLSLIEHAVQSIREDLDKRKSTLREDEQESLAHAAQVLLQDYISDEELTVFTALDGENIHA